MDINLARTFLEVVATGSFMTASERLHVTQSTVSARIRTLEESLGRPLFKRDKAGVVLTPAGSQFQNYATILVRTWQQAKHDISLPAGYQTIMTIGGETSLWDQFLVDWLAWMNANNPDMAIRAENGPASSLIEHLVQGTLDIAVMYTPQQRLGLTVEKLYESRLILVVNHEAREQITSHDYVFIDWGPEFRAYHNAAHPQWSSPRLYVDAGFVGFRHILNVGGAGYVPERIARPYLQDNRVIQVSPDDHFTLPVYAVYPTGQRKEILNQAVEGLEKTAQA